MIAIRRDSVIEFNDVRIESSGVVAGKGKSRRIQKVATAVGRISAAWAVWRRIMGEQGAGIRTANVGYERVRSRTERTSAVAGAALIERSNLGGRECGNVEAGEGGAAPD